MPESSVRHSPIEAYQTESGPAYPLVTHVKALYGTLQGHHQHAQPGVMALLSIETILPCIS